MIQELADQIWDSARFRRLARSIERTWLAKELRFEVRASVTEELAARAMSAAAILACSETLEHRVGALRLSTYVFEAFGDSDYAFDAALRVILTRLKNFPAIDTRNEVATAFKTLPHILALEEVTESDRHTVSVGKQSRLLTGFQHNLWEALRAGQSIALSAPTSVGKSFVLELYLASLFEKGPRIVVYLVPTRALITQVSKELASIFKAAGQEAPEIITIPARPGLRLISTGIYVMTQERLHLTLQSRANFSVDLIIVDEAQSISEGARGILLQGVIEEILSRNPQAQVLFASPTTKNLETFGRIFKRIDIAPQNSKEPAVSQNFLITGRSDSGQIVLTAARETGYSTDLCNLPARFNLRTRVEKLAHIPLQLCHGQPNLIYANGADEAEDIALALAKRLNNFRPTARLIELSRLAKETVHQKYVLADCVLRGVGFHYANIPTSLRRAIEVAFAEGELKYLVCTSTLLQGVNLPAKNIFMLKPTRGQGRPLEPTDFWNLAGRAGRLRREFQGNIFLIDYERWEKKPLRGARDVEIAPAIENSIKTSSEGLSSVIQGKGIRGSKSKKIELESAFVRLFSDLKSDRLEETLSRLELTGDQRLFLLRHLEEAADAISLPAGLLRRSHNVSPRKQQRLYERIKDAAARDEQIVPLPPRDPQAFNSYAAILKLCHEIILGINTEKGLHRFHAVLARKWMLGYSIPRIINEGLRRQREKGLSPDTRQYIRNTLEVIEDAIRFQTIRLFGCYRALFEYAFLESEKRTTASLPDVELFLEIGASDETMVSLISLGLSRAVAIKLAGARREHDLPLNADSAVEWLQSQANNLHSLKLTNIQIQEVLDLIALLGNTKA